MAHARRVPLGVGLLGVGLLGVGLLGVGLLGVGLLGVGYHWAVSTVRTKANPPAVNDVDGLAAAAAGCRACELYADATQTVFGEGPRTARTVLVGEQPGDMEDRAGRPFVGPAGRLLDRALADAGIARGDSYVTNAVKHFRFERREGNQRLHKTPTVTQTRACFPWLQSELALVQPQLIVALGATAARALQGPDFRITAARGQLLDYAGVPFLATVHPAAVLRAPDRQDAYAAFVADLAVAAATLSGV